MKFDSIREAAPKPGEVAAAAGTGAGTAAAVKGVQAATGGAKAAAPVAAQAAKAAAPGLLKTAGGAAMKALPGIGAVYGGYDAYQRAKKGDYMGAGLAAAGGLASFIPGLGTAANLGIQGALVGKDVYSAMNEPETPAAPAAPAAAPAAKPAAQPAGDPNVKALQDRLIAAGAKIKADGIMGPQTQAAMKQFPTAVAEGEENVQSNNPRVERMLKQLRLENPHAQNDIEAILFDYLKNEIEDKQEIKRLDMENDMEEADIDQLQKQVSMLQRKISARKGATLEAKPMSAQERLYQRHQALRKKSGLPDPQYYKDLGEKLRKEIEQLRQEIGNKKDDKLTEFAPGSGDDRDDMNWNMLINMLFRVLNRKGFDFNAEQNYAVFAKGNHLLILEYDTDQPGHFSWRIGIKQPTRSNYVHKVRDIETGTDPISPASVEGLLVKLADALSQGMAEGGPFSYGVKKPRRGSVADLAAKKRKEQEKDKQPVEPRDQMVGVARVIKDVAEGSSIMKLNDYDQWLDKVDAIGAEKHVQKNRTTIIAQTWDGDVVGEFDTRDNQGWIMSQGMAEGGFDIPEIPRAPQPKPQPKSVDEIEENLRKWFKEKWVRFGPDGKIRGECGGRDDSEGKPKCLPASKAHSLGKKGRASAAARKRREDPNPERSGAAINVATKKNESQNDEDTKARAIAYIKEKGYERLLKTMSIPAILKLIKDEQDDWHKGDLDETNLNEKCWDGYAQRGMKKKGSRMVPNCVPVQETKHKCPECGGAMYEESMINEKKDACYYKVKSRYKVWPSAYASGALVKCRKKGAKSWGSKGK